MYKIIKLDLLNGESLPHDNILAIYESKNKIKEYNLQPGIASLLHLSAYIID